MSVKILCHPVVCIYINDFISKYVCPYGKSVQNVNCRL